jgi:hypothetical protein
MHSYHDFVQRIVSRSGVMTSRTRRELERELYAHLEDAVEDVRCQGHDESRILQIVCDRFGSPDEIAREFAIAHRFERRAISIGRSLAFLGTSFATVAAFILAFQLVLAVISGTSPSKAFPHLREEVIGFVSLALGYMGPRLEERLFERRRLAKALVLNAVLFALLFTLTFLRLHLTTLAPAVAFVSGSAVRILQQQTNLQLTWLLGTVVPMAAAFLSAGPLLSAHGDFPLWAAALVRWTGLTVPATFSRCCLETMRHVLKA